MERRMIFHHISEFEVNETEAIDYIYTSEEAETDTATRLIVSQNAPGFVVIFDQKGDFIKTIG